MAFYLKKTRQKGRTYLSIDESFYSHDKKGTAHRCYQSLGSVETWQKKGIADPIAHFQKQVDALNRERAEQGVPKISSVSPTRCLGYFPLKALMEKLRIKKYVDYFKQSNDFQFDLYEMLSSLVYACAVHPCGSLHTFHEELPNLFEPVHYSRDQLLDGLSFMGNEYQKFVEIFTVQTLKVFGLDTSHTYFDSIDFYFDIDQEDEFCHQDPVTGIGVLQDRNQIPAGMEIKCGDMSEKPVMKDVTIKQRYDVTGRTIHVNPDIVPFKNNQDGYLYFKPVTELSEKELDFKEIRDKQGNLLYRCKSRVDDFPYIIKQNGKEETVILKEKRMLICDPFLAAKKRYEIHRAVEKAKALIMAGADQMEYGECGKYVSFTDQAGINQEAVDKDLKSAGYSLLVTSEIKMSDRDLYDTCQNIWLIEETFKIMKSDLDNSPVFCHKEETIKGHFLICYITVLLERLFQFKILDNQYSASEISRLFNEFKVTRGETKYINTTTSSDILSDMAEKYHLPLTSRFLSETQIHSILKCKL